MLREFRVSASPSLRVRSGPGIGFRQVGSVLEGVVVREVERSSAISGAAFPWIWAEEQRGWLRTDYLELIVSALQPAPLNATELWKVFGEPASKAASAGRLRLPEPVKLSWDPSSVTVVACHTKMVPVFEAVFEEIHARGLWGEIQEWGGIYNPRRIGASQKWSTHAWGIAVDINPRTNQQGTVGDIPMTLVQIFELYGFFWGGRWGGSARDPMHFQYVHDY